MNADSTQNAMLVGGHVGFGARRCNVDGIVESLLRCISVGTASMSAMNQDSHVWTDEAPAVARVGRCPVSRWVGNPFGDVASSVGPV